jgi:hypothetical protein
MRGNFVNAHSASMRRKIQNGEYQPQSSKEIFFPADPKSHTKIGFFRVKKQEVEKAHT